MDYYSILGVPKNASQDDIRKAYKKQSMKHHPDRGGDEAQFKKVNEAYQILGDAQKRAEYDNPQPKYNFNSNDFSGFGRNPFDNLNPFYSDFFRDPPQRKRVKNRDIQLSYVLDLKDCFQGKVVTLKYSTPSGKVEVLDVSIPPGIKNNDLVRIQGYGDDSMPNIPRGDLLLRIKLRGLKNWDVDNLDLITTRSVSILDLILGTELVIDTPEGKSISLKIPKGSQPGTTFSITGHGLLSRTGNRGKIFVKVLGRTPKITDEEILNKIKDIKDSLAG